MSKARKLDNWLKSYMAFTKHSEAPDEFHFWTGVSTIAGALRRKVWIDCGYFDWIPNFYIIFVAPPGVVQKSTTAGIGMGLLRQVKDVKFGPDSATWQAVIEEMGKSKQGFMAGERVMRMCAIQVVAGELGTFLKPSDSEMIDALVSLWDGQRGEWRKATKTVGEDRILNPYINLIGCTTPSWISNAFPDYMIGGGFTSRAIFVYADKKRQLVAYPGQRIGEEDVTLQAALLHDLTEISKMAGQIHLTPDAYELGEAWYTDFHRNRPSHLAAEHFGGYVARKQTHIHKLAMVLSAAESNFLTVEKHHLAQAIAVVDSLEADMPKVFERIGQDDQSRKASKVRSIVRQRGKIKLEELWRECITHMGAAEFKAALAGMVMAKECTQTTTPNGTYIKAVGYQEPGTDSQAGTGG